jgi:hypothetical protein
MNLWLELDNCLSVAQLVRELYTFIRSNKYVKISFQISTYKSLQHACILCLSSSKAMTFPVKITSPVTPLLYISNNESHLLSLRKMDFIQKIWKGTPKEIFILFYDYISLAQFYMWIKWALHQVLRFPYKGWFQL